MRKEHKQRPPSSWSYIGFQQQLLTVVYAHHLAVRDILLLNMEALFQYMVNIHWSTFPDKPDTILAYVLGRSKRVEISLIPQLEFLDMSKIIIGQYFHWRCVVSFSKKVRNEEKILYRLVSLFFKRTNFPPSIPCITQAKFWHEKVPGSIVSWFLSYVTLYNFCFQLAK